LEDGDVAVHAGFGITVRRAPGRRRTPTRPPGCIASSRLPRESCSTCSRGLREIAKRLRLEKGAHGVAGILAWPGRYCRHLDRVLPIATEGRADGGTDYYMEPDVATLFAAATSRPPEPSRGGRHRRGLD
jgi:hypothetical protein